MLYYASRISNNIGRREPEGYLICKNVPIARIGTQQYLRDELGESGNEYVDVFRPEDEVFSTETMSSFEGMPVTNDHPDDPDGVTVENYEYLAKGHAQNIRRGEGKDKDLLLADLIIHDKHTIQEVLDGKREISCGYLYELCDENGKYVQRQIRGNHIAIVDRGRAGHRVCIKDSAPNDERSKKKMAKKNHSGILAKMLASLVASDANPEEIEEAVDAIEDITSETEVQAAETPEQENVDAAPEGDVLTQILARLDALEAKLGGADEDPEAEADPLAKLEEDLDEMEGEELTEEEINPDEDPDEQESHFVDPEVINEQDEDEEIPEEEEEPAADCKGRDSIRVAINAIKPLIAKLPPSEQKKAAADAAAALRKEAGLNRKSSRNDYTKLLKARKKVSADSKADDTADLGKTIMAKRNPNYKK